MKDFRQIRAYGKTTYEPASFKGKGIRGWWIRVLNQLRFYLECRVIYHVLRLQITQAGPLANGPAILDEFQKDIEAERRHMMQPPLPVAFHPSPISSVEAHRREVQKVENPRDVTAKVMARYAAGPREKRYAFSRRHDSMIMEAEISEQETTNVQAIPGSRNTASASYAGKETRRTKLKSHRDDAPTAAESISRPAAEDGEDFNGFLSDDDPEAVAERLRAGERARENAAAATEHQRSILPGR